MSNDIVLSTSERTELSALEEVVERNLLSFVEAGNALLKIRDARLYRGTHETFDEYCAGRWNFGKMRASQLIAAASVVREIGGEGTREGNGVIHISEPETQESKPRFTNENEAHPVMPANERQARELARAPEGQRKEAWDEAVRTAPADADGRPRVTAEHVRETVERVTGNGAEQPKPGRQANGRKSADKPKPPKAEKSADPEPDAPEETPRDEIGVPLPDDPAVREAFASLPLFADLMNRISQVKKEVGRIPENAMLYFDGVHGQAFEAGASNARSALKHVRPFGVCPYCRGSGKEPGGSRCQGCHGWQWVPESTWKNAPPEMRAAMERIAAKAK